MKIESFSLRGFLFPLLIYKMALNIKGFTLSPMVTPRKTGVGYSERLRKDSFYGAINGCLMEAD